MTEAVQGGTEWVPRLGMLEVPAERAAVIRGLFELAAWVADHPELPLPRVAASIIPRGGWAEKRAVVDRVAAALGTVAEDEVAAQGSYEAVAAMAGVEVRCFALTAARMDAYYALNSYSGNVQAEVDSAAVAGEVR